MSLAEIGQQLGRECRAVGLHRADKVIALTDGGNGLPQCLQQTVAGQAGNSGVYSGFLSRRRTRVAFAKAVHPQDEAARTSQADQWCHTLKHQGGSALLRELEAWDLSVCPSALTETHRQFTGYLRNNQDRMDYPSYVQQRLANRIRRDRIGLQKQ